MDKEFILRERRTGGSAMKVKVLKRESADYLRESKHEIHKVNKVTSNLLFVMFYLSNNNLLKVRSDINL